MPCWTVQTASIDIGKVDADLLRAAMTALGFPRYQYADGKVTVQGRYVPEEQLGKIKVEYARQVVFSQAKRFNWQMKEVAANKWEVIRR